MVYLGFIYTEKLLLSDKFERVNGDGFCGVDSGADWVCGDEVRYVRRRVYVEFEDGGR